MWIQRYCAEQCIQILSYDLLENFWAWHTRINEVFQSEPEGVISQPE
jgi:hypothetical protein